MKNLAEYTALPENELESISGGATISPKIRGEWVVGSVGFATEFAVAYYYEHRKEKKRYGK